MLKWQRSGNKQPKKDCLFWYLIGISFCLHTITLCFFYLYSNEKPLAFSVNPAFVHDLPIIVVPFTHCANGKARQPAIATKPCAARIARGTQLVSSNNSKKQSLKKKEPLPAKKNTPEKTKPVFKKPTKKNSPADQTGAYKPKLEKKIEHCEKIAGQKVIHPQPVIELTRPEYEAFVLQEEIIREVTAHWKPPVGVPQSCNCRVAVSIDKMGKCQRVSVVDSSGIVLFDASVKRALTVSVYPAPVRGKEIILTLNK